MWSSGRQIIRVPDFRMDAELTCVAGVAGREEAVTSSIGEHERAVFATEKRRDQALPKWAGAG